MSRVRVKNREYISLGQWVLRQDYGEFRENPPHTVLVAYGNYGWWDVLAVPHYAPCDLEIGSLPRASMRGRRWVSMVNGFGAFKKNALRDLSEYVLKNGKKEWFRDGKG